MNLLSLENVTRGYREKNLFENISFGLDEGEKTGLIGINGIGKTTFLKILAGLEPPDSGSVARGNGVTIEYLPQNPEFDDRAPVLQQVFKGASPVMRLLRDYEHALENLSRHPGDADWQSRLLTLNQEMDSLDAWQLGSEAKSALTRFLLQELLDKRRGLEMRLEELIGRWAYLNQRVEELAREGPGSGVST